ncbi:MAG: alanine racemase [Bacteriovoracaceae bacterium]
MDDDRILEVSFAALSHNISEIKNHAGEKSILAMVKANAYGNGAVALTDYMHRKLEIKEFGVATLKEALSLRHNLSQDNDFDLYVFSELGFSRDDASEIYSNNRLIPVLSNKEDLKQFLDDSQFQNTPLVLKFNTGMNRLGLCVDDDDLNDICHLIKKSGRKKIDHYMSHFANASLSLKDNSHNQRQISHYKKGMKFIRNNGIEIEASSLSSSGAIVQSPDFYEETHIRPGLILYGPNPLAPNLRKKFSWKGKIISSLKGRVLNKFFAPKGMPIGYGSLPVNHEAEFCTISLGYADGVSRKFRNLEIRQGDFKGKIFGNVSMDMLALELDKTSESLLKVGDTVSLWGDDPEGFDRVSSHVDAISYEVMCNISSRVKRIYLDH